MYWIFSMDFVQNVHTTFIPFLKFIWQLSMKVNTPKKKKILHLLIISIIVFFSIIVVASFLLSKFNLDRSVALDIHQTQPLTSFSGQNFPWHSICRLRLSMLASMLETERQLADRPGHGICTCITHTVDATKYQSEGKTRTLISEDLPLSWSCGMGSNRTC